MKFPTAIDISTVISIQSIWQAEQLQGFGYTRIFVWTKLLAKISGNSEISEISENFEISTKNISENAVVEDKGVPNVPKVADAVPEAIGSTIVPISTSTSSKNSDKSENSVISGNFEISTKNISENVVEEVKGVPNVSKVAEAVPEAIGSIIVPISTSTSSKNSDKSENSVISGNSKNSTENVSQKTSNVGGNEVTADLESAVASASTGNTSVPVKPTRVPLWRQIK